MIASLAARLAADPSDAPGWAQLIRSYMVLGRPGEAQKALAEARVALGADAAKRAVVDAAARDLGLTDAAP